MKKQLLSCLLVLTHLLLLGQKDEVFSIDSLILDKKAKDALPIITNLIEEPITSLPLKITYATQKIYCLLVNKATEEAEEELSKIKDLTIENNLILSDDNKLRIAYSEIMILQMKKEYAQAKQLFKETFSEVDFSKTSPIINLRFYRQFSEQMRIEKKYDSVLIVINDGSEFINKIESQRLRDRMEILYKYQKAYAHHFSSKLTRARKLFLEVLDKSYSLKDSSRLERLYTFISTEYYRTGEYGQCAHYIKKSYELKLQKYGPGSTRLLREYQNLGAVYSEQKNFEDAYVYYNKGIDLLKKHGAEHSSEMGRIIFNLGTIHYTNEEYDKAIELVKKSLKLREANLDPNHASIGVCLMMLGELHLLQDKYDIAEEYLLKALKIRESLNDAGISDNIKIYANLAHVSMANENFNQSEEYIKKAYDVVGYNTLEPYDFTGIDNPFMLSNPLEKEIRLARVKYEKTKEPNIYEDAQSTLSVADSIVNFMKYRLDDASSRLTFRSKYEYVIDECIMLHSRNHQYEANEEPLVEIFRLIEENNNSLMYEKIASEESNTSMGMPKSITDEKHKLEDSLSYYENRLVDAEGNTDAQVLSKITKYRDLYSKFIKEMRSNHPKYFETVFEYPIVSLDAYKDLLYDDETSITYYLGTINSLALKIDRHDVSLFNLGKSKDVKKMIQTYLSTIKDRSENDEVTNLSKNLYHKLVAPLNIPEDQNITLICNDLMSLLPFETLLKEDGSYLFESNTISYQYSATTRSQLNDVKSSSKNILAMAPIFAEENESQNPLFASLYEADIFRNDLGPLLQSEQELNNIKQNIDGDFYYDEDATERRFKKEAPNAGIIHLATHGFANQNNADKSRLYFHQANDSIEDGMLNAYEIINLDLKNTDLVTLSACNTGDGSIKSGEGVASLGRAFAYAGCQNQLISLWPANDNSTTQLMTNYYSNLKQGQGKSTALKNAKLSYLASAPEIMRHPYYWAGFVYFGEDSPIDLSSSMNYLGVIFGLSLGLLALGYFFKIKRKK